MADQKISAMDAATTLAGPEVVAGVQSSTNVKVSANQLAALTLGPALNSLAAATTLTSVVKFAAYQSGAVAATPEHLATYINTLAVGDVGLRPLFKLTAADMNVDTDQAFTKIGTFSTYIILQVRVAYVSGASLTTAAGGIYSAAAKGGNAIVAAGSTYTNLTGARTGQTIALTALGQGVVDYSGLFLSLTTPQGAAAVAAFYILGLPLT